MISLMISSCCTFRLNRRSALSMDSPSCTFTSAKLITPPFGRLQSPRSHWRDQAALFGPFGSVGIQLGYHRLRADSTAKAQLCDDRQRHSNTRVRASMRVLIAGGGGREHALAWRLARDPGVDARPLRAGQCRHRRRRRDACRSIPPIPMRSSRSPSVSRSISPSSVLSCRSIAASSIAFAPPDAAIFGPPRAAAQLECSKVFAKGFMARHGIPTARYRVCESSARRARRDRVRRVRLSRRAEGRRARRRKGRGRRGGSRPKPTPRSAPRWKSSSSAPPARGS